jgi:hypothetical protein
VQFADRLGDAISGVDQQWLDVDRELARLEGERQRLLSARQLADRGWSQS